MTHSTGGNMSHVDEGTLHAYLDGELPAAERTALESHVAQCAACRANLAEERALIARAGQLLAAAQPADRPAPPLHQLRQRPIRRPWHVRTPVAWAASVVLALVAGYSLREEANRPAPVASEVAADGYLARTETGAAEERPATTRGARQAPAAAPVDSIRVREVAPPPAADVVAIGPPADRRRTSIPTPIRTEAERDELAANTARAAAPGAPGAPPAPALVDAAPRRVSGMAGGQRLVATEWPIIRRGSARDLLGTDPVGIPGLVVRQIRRSPSPDATVLVEQQIDSSTVIQLYQRAAASPREAMSLQERRDAAGAAGAVSKVAATDRLARFVGGLRVEISGPLSQDSLNRLLEQLKPLP